MAETTDHHDENRQLADELEGGLSDAQGGEEQPQRSLLGLITDVQNGLSKNFRARTQDLGISRSQWRVLAMLQGRPGMTQTELADLIGVGRAPIGKIIDRLEEQGWVERRADPSDRRVNRLYLTRDTRPVIEPTREISNAVVDELLADLPTEDIEAFRRAITHLHRKLGFNPDLVYYLDDYPLDDEDE